MPKNAIKDWFGNTSDSLKMTFGVATRKETGNLNLTLENLNPKKNYILQIINTSNVIVEEREILFGKATSLQIFSFLSPDTYKIRIITDENQNKRWDIGDYDLKKQPEPIFLQKIEQAVRAGWDVEAKVKVENY
jgi:uncharacterized protein (DUF2141 family)